MWWAGAGEGSADRLTDECCPSLFPHRRNMIALSRLGVSWNWALDCFRVRRVGVYWVLLSVREDGLVDGPEGDWRHGKVETRVRRGG